MPGKSKTGPMSPLSMTSEPVDYEQLEDYLRALAFSTRLELVHKLRVPQPLQDIRVTPKQNRPGENPDRAISRQGVEGHLAKLEEIGVVESMEEEGRRGKLYHVNPRKLYQITEEFRRLSILTLGAPTSADATVEVDAPAAATREDAGPRLVLVHGLLEGKAFALRRKDLHDGRGWIIGRKPGLHATLDYDPYVSLENSEIVPHGNGFHLLDLRSSRNGTRLNWRMLAPDERAPLKTGDIIGVGRSLFVFRAE